MATRKAVKAASTKVSLQEVVLAGVPLLPRLESCRESGLAAIKGSEVCRTGHINGPFLTNSCLAGAERGKLRTVLSKSQKESFERPLPSIIKDFGGRPFIENRLTRRSEDVVDSTDAKALAKGGKFCLRILTQLHAFMRGPDDVCLLRSRTRPSNVLPRS